MAYPNTSGRVAFYRREATENAIVYVQMSVRVFAGPLQWRWNSAERQLPRLFHYSSVSLSSAMSATNRLNAAIIRDSAVNENRSSRSRMISDKSQRTVLDLRGNPAEADVFINGRQIQGLDRMIDPPSEMHDSFCLK
jgi:hypothetical protein